MNKFVCNSFISSVFRSFFFSSFLLGVGVECFRQRTISRSAHLIVRIEIFLWKTHFHTTRCGNLTSANRRATGSSTSPFSFSINKLFIFAFTSNSNLVQRLFQFNIHSGCFLQQSMRSLQRIQIPLFLIYSLCGGGIDLRVKTKEKLSQCLKRVNFWNLCEFCTVPGNVSSKPNKNN